MGIHDGHREKMRNRFLTAGLDAFADHEALELLLYYAIPRRDTNPTAHALMERYGSLSAVLEAPAEDLRKVEGVGESALHHAGRHEMPPCGRWRAWERARRFCCGWSPSFAARHGWPGSGRRC